MMMSKSKEETVMVATQAAATLIGYICFALAAGATTYQEQPIYTRARAGKMWCRS